MKKNVKALAAIMLMTAAVFVAGCNNASNGGEGENGKDSAQNHEYVDLGLRSGTLWATCNVGANKPEEYGDYFAWGETKPKTVYDENTYKCAGTYDENHRVLQPKDDAATANWGKEWRMPTLEQWEELYNSTDYEFTTQNGVKGALFTADNGKSLFLPATGGRMDDKVFEDGAGGAYWASTLDPSRRNGIWRFFFVGEDRYDLSSDRPGYFGFSVRPVRASK